MEPIVREALIQRLEELKELDPIAKRLQSIVRKVIPQESQLKDAVSGTWLGHPLHPPLTDVVIGMWTSAWFLDFLGGEDSEGASDRLIGAGILAAVPTAIAGLSDWAELFGGSRRVGSLHAIGNTTALGLQGMSWLARKRGRRGLGVGLSMVGMTAATASAWLGGHLSFGRGVGVDQTVFESLPTEWTDIIDENQLADGKLTPATVNGVSIAVVKSSGQIHAMLDRCSHRGCSLHEGDFDGSTITCPCHGSAFRLDGSVAKGPAAYPQPSLEVRVRDGRVEVSSPDSG
jgi:nitrite reductase/ring-hydroxylating ferredoxin subunit/uncharacterized membrane protein